MHFCVGLAGNFFPCSTAWKAFSENNKSISWHFLDWGSQQHHSIYKLLCLFCGIELEIDRRLRKKCKQKSLCYLICLIMRFRMLGAIFCCHVHQSAAQSQLTLFLFPFDHNHRWTKKGSILALFKKLLSTVLFNWIFSYLAQKRVCRRIWSTAAFQFTTGTHINGNLGGT